VKSSRASRTLCALTLAISAAMAVDATAAEDSGWYVGAGAGQSRARIDDARIVGGLLESGFDTTAIKDDNRHFAYKLFGGYQFNRYFALEGGYFDLGRFGFTADTVPAAGLTGNTKLTGANLDAVGTLPLSEKFAVFARVGYDYTYAKDAFAGYGEVVVSDPHPSTHSSNYKFGVGLRYELTDHVSLRTEVERYRVEDAVGNRGDIDLLSAGIVYRFGRGAPAPLPRATAISETAPAPAPAPRPEPVPVPVPAPLPRHITLSADSLFDFAQATIRPAGRHSLDEFAAQLDGSRYAVITIRGYTDRLGTAAYNEKLSMRRAQAVKSYLVESRGLPADKLSARGEAGSAPVTQPGECPGERQTAALIACLQPDRRVDVEVSETQEGRPAGE
jgi:OOP family OmpA-OmpF porin